MAVSVAEEDSVLGRHRIRSLVIDLFAGAICSILSIAYCLSYAALIFTGPLAHLIAYGVAMTLFSAAVGGAVVALRSSLPFAVAGPDSSISVVLAALVATMLPQLGSHGGQPLAPTLIVLSFATGLTGLWLALLGFTHAGRAIRFIPYPVIGGFLGATGWLMMTGAVRVVTDRLPTLANLDAFVSGAEAGKVAAAAALALALRLIMPRTRSAFALPGILVAAAAITHLALPLAGVSLAQAQTAGWLFHPHAAATLTLPWKPVAIAAFPWRALPLLAGDLIAVMFVTTVTLLLNTTGIEMATATEADIERDLRAHGLANLITAALGGLVSCTSLSRSTLVRLAGANGRLSGLTVAAICAALLLTGPGFLGAVPKYILGGLLLYLGFGLLEQWLVRTARQLPLMEYLSLVAIAALIVYFGFVAGILIGVVIGCGTFAFSASRVNAIKYSFDGSEFHSSLVRSPDELALLMKHGPEIQGMALQSYLFFGSVNRLYQHVKELLAKHPTCRFLIFDFRRVTGIDSSATHSFEQISRAAADRGARIVFVNLSPELAKAFRAAKLIGPFRSADIVVAVDLDHALEPCEQAIIEAYRAGNGGPPSLRGWFTEVLGSAELAETLAAFCRRLDVETGDIIARQGDAASSMHFILDGRVGVFVDPGNGTIVRLRSLGPRTTVGEMGLIAHQPRSATIKAEAASVLYELDAATFEQIKRERPLLSQALLGYVVTVMTERLSFANRLIGVLQR